MDGGERRSSQYGTPYQTTGARRSGTGQVMGPPSDTRYSQNTQSPGRTGVARSSVARPYLPSYPYGYQDAQYHPAQMHSSSPMQGVEMQYTPTYVQDPSRSGQMQPSPSPQQQYPAYAQGSMLPHGPQQPMYEGLHQYQQRQSAAIEVMASQFGGLPPYMQHGEQASVGVTTGPSSFMTTQSEPAAYGGMSIPRPQLQPPFSTPITEYQTLEHSETQDDPEEGSSSESLEEGQKQYEQQLKATFTAIAAGRVTEAGEKLLLLTRWLLTSVRRLGLHHDEEGKHEERIVLWREFNHSWEALGQKQKDITENAMRSRRQPQDILSATTITTMVDELVRLCDQIEKYGLVDYEIGVWEEQIVSIFSQCLDLLPANDGGNEGDSRDAGRM